MDRLDGCGAVPLGGVAEPSEAGSRRSQQRCAQCQRFARLLPGETDCAACTGVLALEFATITGSADAAGRGGW